MHTSSSANPMLAELAVPPAAVGLRLDMFLTESSSLFVSRKSAYKAIKRCEVLCNGASVAPNYVVMAGDCIRVFEDTRALHPPLELKLDVVYEDDFVAVVVKPPGIPVSGNYARTVLRALPHNLLRTSQTTRLRTPAPAHRLDAPTGGLLLVAKTASALAELNRQFQARTVHKRYRALAAGPLPAEVTVQEPVDDRHAVTHFRKIDDVPSLNYGRLTRVDCFPETGRRHQIRQHLAHLGAPVVGDQTYGSPGKVLKSKGLFLWAVEIAFQHPATGESIHVQTDEPPKFQALMQREERRS